MPSTVLVVAAHPDDEVLGCGGTIAHHSAQGDTVHIIFMADGVGSRAGEFDLKLKERQMAQERAMKILGVVSSRSLGFPDNRMDSLTMLDIVQPLEKLIFEIQPSIVYTHHCGDLNIDHQLTHQAVLTACRPLPTSKIRDILAFEVMSSTEWTGSGRTAFIPNIFVDISEHWPKKLKALKAYEFEMRPPPHSRSIEHLDVLAKHRGSCIGLDRAEAFMMIRGIR